MNRTGVRNDSQTVSRIQVLKRETKSIGGGSRQSLSRFQNSFHHAFLFTNSFCHEAERETNAQQTLGIFFVGVPGACYLTPPSGWADRFDKKV